MKNKNEIKRISDVEDNMSAFTSHYVMITGMINDMNEDDIYYIISTWGKKCIISEKDLIKKTNILNSYDSSLSLNCDFIFGEIL